MHVFTMIQISTLYVTQNSVLTVLSVNFLLICALNEGQFLNRVMSITKGTVSEGVNIRDNFGWFDHQALTVPQVR